MKTLRTIIPFCIALFPAYLWGASTTADPFLGRWVLDVRTSHYAAKTCPKSMTIEMTQAQRGVHYQSHTEPAVGEAFDVEYTADYDGKPAIVTGSKGILLPVSLQRKGDAVIATYRNAFQIAATSQRVLSDHDHTMTITTVSYDSAGNAVTNVGVYRKAK
ncbi:hypothetical protein [Terriglobus sp. TAA 43]|uniref:hypothetical protein n=1 Tax=Terriglobus sp. TAA 43 TaxID=278961 RepID=UPI000647EE5B|nr:hypothetical protein [Terriglobus sp. TAA 43]